MAHRWQYIMAMMACMPALTGCGSSRCGLRAGDLMFQVSCHSDFCDAISQSTSYDCGIDFVHVGIFAVVDGDSVVIEASSDRGVVLTPLAVFIDSAEPVDGAPGVVAMRYPDGSVARRAVDRALTLLGLPYDWEFEQGNGKVYCSELVQYSFVDKRGAFVFESEPMNFTGSDGDYPKFWVDLYGRMGKPIPQGAPGTNPNGIYAHKRLKPVTWP